MQNEQNPRTARDALIIELLGDLGVVHDEIKNLPNHLKDSLRESLTLIANSVQEAETTAERLSAQFSVNIDAETNAKIMTTNEEINRQIQRVIQTQLSNELNMCAETLSNIRNTLAKFPSSFRPRIPVWPFAVLGVVIAGMAFGMFRMYQQNDATLRNTMSFYRIYEQQQGVIRTLPPEVQQKFK